MTDFYQNGIVTTLHNLTRRPVDEMERELVGFSRVRPMSLVLPSLYSELEGPALAGIVEHLCKVPYLNEIVIGLDRANEEEYRKAQAFFAPLPQHFRILWNDGPRLMGLHEEIAKQGLAPTELGKGRNVWYCLGYVLASGRSTSVALHDCDIVTYDRELLARLLYPVANPNFNYDFCKGYYARFADGRLNGRVTRLLVTPLIRALKKVVGSNDYLDYMDSFRYPLSGEFSMRTDVINDLRIPSDWGLEIGSLSEMHRNYATNHICQVDIADGYDHKHQSVSFDNEEGGLSKMSIDIAKALFRKLATHGVVFSQGSFRAIKAAYFRIALDMVETYRNDAVMNGLAFDLHEEEEQVELFAQNILRASAHFLENPMETPFIPNWNRVVSAMPDVLQRFTDAVEEDHRQYAA